MCHTPLKHNALRRMLGNPTIRKSLNGKAKTTEMTIAQLIKEYTEMAARCYNLDYSDKKAVKRNNKAVNRMYEIVHKIIMEYGENGIKEFIKLIDIKQNQVDLWAAVHTLEKMSVDESTEEKALMVIQDEAKDSLGMEYWLRRYHEKKKYGT
jgi:hypothetical protein